MATDDGQLGNGEPNRDPITGAPGAHPVGTGLGATGGALAGAAAGSLAGPVGTVVGLVAAGRSDGEILRLYPYLAADDIREALSYAAWRVEELEVPLAAG